MLCVWFINLFYPRGEPVRADKTKPHKLRKLHFNRRFHPMKMDKVIRSILIACMTIILPPDRERAGGRGGAAGKTHTKSFFRVFEYRSGGERRREAASAVFID